MLPPVTPKGERSFGICKFSGNGNKKIIISQDDGSLSLFLPLDLEDELQGDENDPLPKVMFLFNEIEPQPETKAFTEECQHHC